MVKRIRYFTRPKTLRCGGGRRFVVYTDEKLTAFLELKTAIGESLRCLNAEYPAMLAMEPLRACPRPENRLQDALIIVRISRPRVDGVNAGLLRLTAPPINWFYNLRAN
jgi:hypothetical protein